MRKKIYIILIASFIVLQSFSQSNKPGSNKDSINTLTAPVDTSMILETMAAEAEENLYTPQVIPPSPTAASLGQYGDVPVSNYTGVPSISIPVYTVKSGEIELPISLSYHASGIKVAQEASWVGLGWALNAGGVITRSVRGLDDLKYYGYVDAIELPATSENIPDIYSDPDFDFYDQLPYWEQIFGGTLDGEPDMFFFNFQGQSGKMIFEKSNTSVIKGKPLKQTETTFFYNKLDSSWTVTDKNGWKYYFGTKEISQNYSTSGFSTFRYTRLDTIQGIYYPNHSISAWYIDSLVTPKGDRIDFEYDKQMRATIGQINYNEVQHQRYTTLYEPHYPGNMWYGYTGEGSYYNISASMQQTSDVYLNRIDFNNGYVEFSTSDKLDMRQEYYSVGSTDKPQKLDKIEVFDTDDVPFKKTTFNYSYFNEHINGYNKENYWRLKLNSAQESAFNETNSTYLNKPSYTFAYNQVQLPAKNSSAIDHWGYYNGQLGNDNVPNYLDRINESWDNYNAGTTLIVSDEASIMPRKYLVPHGVFKDCSELSFGPHHFENGAFRELNESTIQASILEKIEYPTGGTNVFTFEPNEYYVDDDDGYGPEYIFEDKLKEIVLYSGDQEEPESEMFSLTHCTRLWLECNIISYNDPLNTLNIEALVEKATGEDIVSIQPLNESGYNFTARVEILLPPGDYRLVADSNYDWDHNIEIELKVKYVVREFSDLRVKVGGGLRISKIETLDSPGETAKTKQYNYLDATNYRSSGIAMTQINHIYFNGQFSTNATWDPLNSVSIPSILVRSSNTEIPLGSSAQGNFVGYSLVEVMDKDIAGDSLGRSEYYYTNESEELTPHHVPGVYGKANHANGELIKEKHFDKYGNLVKTRELEYITKESETKIYKAAVTPFSMHVAPWINGYEAKYFMRFYDVVSDWRFLKSDITTMYSSDGSGTYTTQIDSFYYDNTYHKQLSRRRIQSSDGKTIETRFYYPQDYDTTQFFTTLINKNIIGKPIDTRTYNNSQLISGTQTEYDNDGQPIKTYVAEIQEGVTDIEFDDNEPYKFTDRATYGYNTDKVLKQVSPVDNINTSYIWGYTTTYPVAKIENIAHSSISSTVVTNIKNHSFTHADVYADIQTDVNYLKSQLATYINNDNYMVTLYTYKPLVGMTSQTGPDGRTTYYEYDSFGRLKFTRNHLGEINSKQHYHYANE